MGSFFLNLISKIAGLLPHHTQHHPFIVFSFIYFHNYLVLKFTFKLLCVFVYANQIHPLSFYPFKFFPYLPLHIFLPASVSLCDII